MRRCLVTLVATVLPAQIAVDAHLHGDSLRQGAPAIVWLREAVFAKLSVWPNGRDPLAACRLTLSARGEFACEPWSCASDDGGFEASIVIDGVGTIAVAGTKGGAETWEIRGGHAPTGRLGGLIMLLGLDQPCASEVAFDVAALVANLLTGVGRTALEHEALTIGPAHIGELRFSMRREGDVVRIEGASGGGMLLPAALAWLAWEHSSGTRLPRWVLLARSARDSGREEAARQLVRSGETSAHEALVRLLSADDYSRVVAMESLARRADARDLSTLVSAASPKVLGSEAIARDATLAWFGRATPDAQRDLLQMLASNESQVLRALPRELQALRTASFAPGPASARAAPQSAPRAWQWVAATLSLLAIVFLMLRGRATT